VGFVKPHGALYGRMADDAGTAAVVLDALQEFGDLALLAPAGTRCLALAADRGVRAVPEAFADRAYAADGSLVPRGAPGAVVTGADEVARRALRLATEGVVEAVDGALVDLQPASICVHGDTQGAPGIAAAVRRALEGAGVTVAPFTARPS